MPTLMTTATLSRVLPSRSPKRPESVSHSPIAPETTAKLKIVLAKSYSAQAIGIRAWRVGVRAPNHPSGPPGPLDAAAASDGLATDGRVAARDTL